MTCNAKMCFIKNATTKTLYFVVVPVLLPVFSEP